MNCNDLNKNNVNMTIVVMSSSDHVDSGNSNCDYVCDMNGNTNGKNMLRNESCILVAPSKTPRLRNPKVELRNPEILNVEIRKFETSRLPGSKTLRCTHCLANDVCNLTDVWTYILILGCLGVVLGSSSLSHFNAPPHFSCFCA